MAQGESDLASDIKRGKSEAEKSREQTALQELYQPYPLPSNVSDMHAYVFMKFTLRDIIVLCIAFLVPILLTLPLQMAIGQIPQMILAIILGLPLAFIGNRHMFTGDLPIEERIKIAMSDRGANNLMHWDKTKKNGAYVDTSTQSFVPQISFTRNNFVMLPYGQGGFSVIEVTSDDIEMAKNSDKRNIVESFHKMLDHLVTDTECVPIQIFMKSVPVDIRQYITDTEDNYSRIRQERKYTMAARTEDYWSMLYGFDSEISYSYAYYIIVTYRKDAEKVGDDTMNTMGNRRQKLQENMNPLARRQKALAELDHEIGVSDAEKLRATMRENEFGPGNTLTKLTRRTSRILNDLNNIQSGESQVKAQVLTREEIAKLFFECYNDSDKNTVAEVIDQAIPQPYIMACPGVGGEDFPSKQDTQYPNQMYEDFPDLFHVEFKQIPVLDEPKMRGGIHRRI